MRIGYAVFLAVAEELSISKAAQQLHITQQCASDHIKRLEKEFNVALFERKPKFQLTAAGEVMRQSLQNMQILEASMSRNLDSIARGARGTFTLGISTSRAPIILPQVLQRYYQEFPNVNISFTEEDTKLLEEDLLSGKIDLFIGINTTPHADYEITTLVTEGIMLVISDALLRQHFNAGEIEKMRNGVDLNQFSKVPFVLSFKSGKVNHAIQEYLIYNNVQLNVPYNISDIKTQIQLCATGLCASLCPKMLLQNAYIHNSSCQNKQSYLHAFPIKHLGRDLHIDLVSHKNVMHPDFIRRFVDILKEEVAEIARRELLEETF